MKTENQELIDKLDLAIESVNNAIRDLEDVKIAMDKSNSLADRHTSRQRLGRSYLYRINGVVYNGLAIYTLKPQPEEIEQHPGFIDWLDKEWVKLK